MFLAGGMARSGLDTKAASDDFAAAAYGAAAAAFVYIFTSVFGATWLTVPWLYPAEIFPLEVRAKGNAWGVVGWSIGNGWLTLLCPVINIITPPMGWALYPEGNQCTLEGMDLLFAADRPWVWDAEENFAKLTEQHPELIQTGQ
ncbi:uncharacterized protein K441DRAFT_687134 [Cenococcum geophilum 1.58]|uniref:uncharacterized protein n=1 Tax=Cenococcum geophilum 1.58 TaxID=794803 RepID=UPI00358E06F5|nr:hypothetical protein K441DRAFT_687134 [Cenococcum geophilum 1.58]